MTTSHTNAPALRIGILGCANIAKQFVRDVTGSPKINFVAAASRRLESAVEFSKTFGIERSYASYEALLADGNLDAVYIPLPNSMHAEWAIKAADAGKHVLCEKPLALGLQQAKSMFDAARKNKVMLLEAFPYEFQPQTRAMLKLLREGEIGNVRSVQACFGFTLANPNGNIRLNPELGGGALLDAGSYALSVIRLAMGCAPVKVMADATWADSGVDISTTATLYYADGRRTQLSCAMDAANHRRATIAGSAGTLETEYLNHTSTQGVASPYGYLPSKLRVRRGTANTVTFEEITCATGSGFRFAAEAFSDLVAASDFATINRSAQASLDNAATLEAIGRSARLGERVTVEI
jgi:predicted dehydrogenase